MAKELYLPRLKFRLMFFLLPVPIPVWLSPKLGELDLNQQSPVPVRFGIAVISLINWSGWQESNLPPRGPKPRVSPRDYTPIITIFLHTNYSNVFVHYLCYLAEIRGIEPLIEDRQSSVIPLHHTSIKMSRLISALS